MALLALAALLIAGIIAAAPYKPGVVVECVETDEERDEMKRLAIDALDHAYHEHVQDLYKVWMKDSHGQPQRAQAGISKATKAWLDARRGMGDFTPPGCSQ